MTPKRTTILMTDAAIKQLIAQGVADALVDYDANRSSRNGDDSHDSRSGGRRHVHTTRLTQWFEKMEYVFYISNCTVACQIKFAACTLLGSALTWWNSHVKTISHDAAYGMSWKSLIKMLTDNYTQHFQELALMCGRMFPEESDQVEKYVGGLLDMIQDRLKTREKSTTTQATTAHNNRLSRGKMQLRLILLGLVKRRSMLELYHCATSASFTIMARALGLQEWFSELKNRNNENKAGGTEARGMANALGGGETDQEPNNIEDDINA
ncbi:hypothetical protein Tco_1180738 [Tanacetum coccineum]